MARPRLPITDEERKARGRESKRKWIAKQQAADPEGFKKRCSQNTMRWRKNNPERAKAAKTRFKKAHPEWDKNYDRKHKDRHRNLWLQRRYGITQIEYETMLTAQSGRCAICSTDKPGGKNRRHWCVDHCHDSNTVRNLLCHACNAGLGLFRHNTDILQHAITYIKKFNSNLLLE